MAAYVRAADAVRDAFDCCVPIIHHCGHNTERPRGHSSLLGAVDVQIAVKRDAADNIVATVELAKDGATGLEMSASFGVVEVGLDDDGDMMTSCVIEPVGELGIVEANPAPRPKRLTNSARICLRALHTAVDELARFRQRPTTFRRASKPSPSDSGETMLSGPGSAVPTATMRRASHLSAPPLHCSPPERSPSGSRTSGPFMRTDHDSAS